MPRPASPYYDNTERCWRSKGVGRISEKTGRPVGMRNYDIGPPRGVDAAANRRAAQAWLDEILIAESKSLGSCMSAPTFAELAERYLEWAKPRIQERTWSGYRERLGKVCAWRDGRGRYLGDRLASDLSVADTERLTRQAKELQFKPTRVRDLIVAAKTVTAWGARVVPSRVPERILLSDPLADAVGPRLPAPPKRYAGPLARREFFAACVVRLMQIDPDRAPMRWRFDRLVVAMWRFLAETGARPDEACRLRWGHIDWRAGVATLRGKTTEATGAMRRIPLPASTARLLRAISRLPGRHAEFVFTHASRAGGSSGDLAGVEWTTNALDHKFKAWRDEFAGPDQDGIAAKLVGDGRLTLYQLRRDLGADVLRMTGSHSQSAEVLGHSPTVNARHYSSFADSHATSLADRVDRIRRGLPDE